MNSSKTCFLTPNLGHLHLYIHMDSRKTDSLNDYCLTINRYLKKAYLGRYSYREIDLVYSDNLEDIDMQLLFYGFKIVKDSKMTFGGYSLYNIRPI